MTSTAPQVGDTITTAEARDALPARAVVRSSAGTIAAKVDDSSGVCFGVAADFPWSRLALPLTVLYLPGQPPRPEREVKAEALRQARDAILTATADIRELAATRGWRESGQAHASARWLDARADRIARGDA